MNDDRRDGRQQCPARPDDGGHALACVVGRGCRKSGRSVSPRYQPDNLRRGLIRYSQIEDLEAALPKAMLDREAIPYEAAFLAGKCFLAYRQRGGTKRSPLPGLFYWRPRGGCRVSAADPRRCALSQLLSSAVVDRPDCLRLSPRGSANAICGSMIQNSARWRLVFEFSAREGRPERVGLGQCQAIGLDVGAAPRPSETPRRQRNPAR